MKCRLSRILDTKSSKSIRGSQSLSVSITTDTKSPVVNKNRPEKPFYKLEKRAERHHNFKSTISTKEQFQLCEKKINNDYKNDGAVPNVQSGIAVLQYTARYTREKGNLHFREESKSDITHSKEIQKSSNVSAISHF